MVFPACPVVSCLWEDDRLGQTMPSHRERRSSSKDFSASAVEKFLRFMYSGSVEGSVTTMMEVAAMADKYQVDALQSLCLPLVRQALKPELAGEIFAAADRFHMDDLRAPWTPNDP